MSAANAKVADILRQYAAVLVMEGADRFKVKSYRRAADVIETLDADVGKMVERGDDLQAIPTVGKAISYAIHEIVTTGSMPQLNSILSRTKSELVELTARPALDPKKVMRIYKKLNIGSIAELRGRLEKGEINDVFGSRMAFHVRQGLDERPRMLLETAEAMAAKIESFLKSGPGVERVAIAGSLRRKKDTVGDLNFLIATSKPVAVHRRFSQFGGVTPNAKGGRAEGSFTLSSGLGVTLTCVRPEQWGMALILSTGAVPHLADLRTLAARKKLTLSAESFEKKGIAVTDEAQIYRRIGLSFIAPELREGRGEVQAAAKKVLPELITREDIRGDLHMHTTASDGANSIADMAAAAKKRGYEYIAITDHSQSLKIANGLSEKRLLANIKQIDAYNARQKNFVVLKSAEVDILQDGSLDYRNALLKELDFTICSIHSRFGLDRQQQTDRIRRAMDNRYFNILGHATGRLLLKREGYELDMESIFEHAKANGCHFEINSSPDRLDLSDEHARIAKELGIQIAINSRCP